MSDVVMFAFNRLTTVPLSLDISVAFDVTSRQYIQHILLDRTYQYFGTSGIAFTW